jgi:energy-coupling factor transport system permease protein
VLSGALERSLTLAASMDARGYGRTTPGAHRVEAKARATILGGLLLLAAGGGLALAARNVAAIATATAGATVVALGLRTLSKSVTRTRMRAEPSTPWDRALIVVSIAIAAAAIALRGAPEAHWYAYPQLQWPSAHPMLIAIAAALAAPVPLGAVRAARLRYASKRSEAAPA